MKDSTIHLFKMMACALFVGIFCFAAYKTANTLLTAKQEQDAFDRLGALVSEQENSAGGILPLAEEIPSTEEKSNPKNEESDIDEDSPIPLKKYIPLYELNIDFYGWLAIAGTEINYPVMFTPWESEYYLRRDFYGDYSQSGTPFIDGDCPADGSYLLVYGHHMKNKTMFGALPDYADQSFYEEHRIILFDTLYEQREYEVVAAFYSRLYEQNEAGVFRYYAYKDLSDPQVFEDYMSQVNAAAIYDTGVHAEYGDQILVLSTCNYHTSDGRFVVVARRVEQEALR